MYVHCVDMNYACCKYGLLILWSQVLSQELGTSRTFVQRIRSDGSDILGVISQAYDVRLLLILSIIHVHVHVYTFTYHAHTY